MRSHVLLKEQLNVLDDSTLSKNPFDEITESSDMEDANEPFRLLDPDSRLSTLSKYSFYMFLIFVDI